MTDPYHAQEHDLGDAVQLDNAETLAGPLNDDPLDSGWVPPDRPVGLDKIDEESLDERLREEEPEPDDVPDEEPEPRAGRLIAPDEGAHPDDEPAEVATDVGVDGGAASAEEAAVHVREEG